VRRRSRSDFVGPLTNGDNKRPQARQPMSKVFALMSKLRVKLRGDELRAGEWGGIVISAFAPWAVRILMNRPALISELLEHERSRIVDSSTGESAIRLCTITTSADLRQRRH
jgi:hypothetical protein